MGKNGKAQTALEYAVVRGMLKGMGWLPRPLAVATGRGMARLAYTLAGRLRRTGERNLELAFPGISESERQNILRGSFTSLGRLLGEFSHFERTTPEELRRIVEFDGLENLEAARAGGRGVIVFTAHLGAWELLSFALSAFGYPMSFLVRRIDNPHVEQLVEKTRTRFGNRSIDKRAAARPVMRVLREGGIVGILIDLNTQEHEGVFVDFFGTPASTTTSLAKLALRTEAAVIPFCMPWDDERQRFLMRIDPPLPITRTGNEDQDVLRLTSLFTSVIEGYVRRYPDQWLWIHKRWNTRPVGEAEIYQ
ncbi:MAG: lysophospholipid acyltransferase family protein [Pyrinomonadaceae bacterium]